MNPLLLPYIVLLQRHFFISKVLAHSDQSHMLRQNAFLILNLLLNHFDCVCGLY